MLWNYDTSTLTENSSDSGWVASNVPSTALPLGVRSTAAMAAMDKSLSSVPVSRDQILTISFPDNE